MERERLTRLVQDAAAVERGDLADLDALAKRFPWFAGAQVLRSVGVQRAGDVLADETLRDAAAHVPSRSALFDVVRQGNAAPKPVVAKSNVALSEPPPPASVVAQPTLQPEPKAEAVAGAPIAAEVLTIVRPEPEPVPEPVVEAGVTETPSTELPVLQPQEEELAVREALDELLDASEGEPAEAGEDDPLERQILESALASAYDFTWTQDTPARTPSPDPIPPPEEPITFPSKGPLVANVPLERKPAITRHGKHSFMDWLEADNAGSTAETKPKPQAEPVPTAISDWVRSEPAEQDEEVEDRPIHIRQKPPVKPLPEDPTATSDLIDAFIKQQAPAPATKAEFFTPQQAAKRSLDDKAGLVTETLARVYAKQGNVPKAIEAYRRLALKYPEKSAYFATLQKELEAQLNK
ncbi:MAG: hypothetical protein JNM62_02435 [Flavobacteriales bacterium]|nr:hypothetical protein [Flavobacteriales bacterium]